VWSKKSLDYRLKTSNYLDQEILDCGDIPEKIKMADIY